MPPFMRQYITSIREKVDRQWTYPKTIIRYKVTARVVVLFTVGRSGELEALEVVKGSGYSDLDEEALRAVKAAAPFPPLPPEFNKERLEIDVGFNYENIPPK